jgi:hypothetical protein
MTYAVLSELVGAPFPGSTGAIFSVYVCRTTVYQ